MALVACPECAASISTAAASCPKCGAPNKKFKKPTPPAAYVILAVLAFWGISALFRGSEPEKPPSENAPPKATVEAPEPEPAPIPKLDFSKKIYTRIEAIICPYSILNDTRAGHGQADIVNLFGTVWGRADAAHEMGCEVVQPGIEVRAKRLGAESQSVDVIFVGHRLAPSFTFDMDLTNNPSGMPG